MADSAVWVIQGSATKCPRASLSTQVKLAAVARIVLVVLVLVAWFVGDAGAQGSTGTTYMNQWDANPFRGKPLATSGVYAEPQANYQPWSGATPPLGDYASEYFERKRLGAVSVSAGLRLYIDVVADKVHFPSFVELIEAKSGAVLGRFPVKDTLDPVWYFPGNGFAYLNQAHMDLCGPRYTRKFAVKGTTLLEVSQALVFVGADTHVFTLTPLYETPAGRTLVATLPADSIAHVIGLMPGQPDGADAPLLVRTPLGLVGWHLRQAESRSGQLGIHSCN